MAALLRELKAEYPFLREAHSQALQQTLADLDKAYRRSMNPNLKCRSPRFKKKNTIGFRYPQAFRIDGSGIYLSKIGWIGFRKSRDIEGRPKNACVKFDGLHWYIAIQTETETETPGRTLTSGAAVGIDVGIAHFAALSDGSFVDGPNALRKYSCRLSRLQRCLARKRLFSSNWRKCKQKITQLHRKVSNIRADFLHKTSTAISKNNALVVMERLRITAMAASAHGTLERPGRNAKAKAALNSRILDQGWDTFRRQLEYKLLSIGGTLLLVNPRNTSRRCSICGSIDKNNRTAQSRFRCVACNFADHADTNAAVNLLLDGLKAYEGQGYVRIACGGSSLDGPAKKEHLRAPFFDHQSLNVTF